MPDGQEELRPLQTEVLRRLWDGAINDPRPGVPMDEVLARLKARYQAMPDSQMLAENLGSSPHDKPKP